MSATNQILLPICHVDEAARLLPLARAIAKGWQGQVELLGIVCVAPEESLSTGAVPAQEMRQALARLATGDPLVDLTTGPKVSYSVWQEIRQRVQECSYALLILPWQDEGRIYDRNLAQVLAEPPCDLAIVRPDLAAPHSILLPIRGGPHAELALRVCLALAETYNADITALHTAGEGLPAAADAPFVNLLPALQEMPAVSRLVTLRRPTAAAIVSEARQHDMVVMGAAARPQPVGQPPAEAVGAITAAVFRETTGTVIAVKTRQQMVYPEVLAESPEALPDVSTVVDKWFAENTFHSREFEDLDALLALKRNQGVTISLGLPALNEEKTVGNVIGTIKEALMDRVPLLDEIVLIDSNSTDRTREIARAAGVPVYIHQEILPELGAYRGKGEALWKSLHVLRGDIIAWIDTDILNIDPRFVYGVLGPLLREERVQYVKGFYRRPLHVGDQLQSGGGGRVTELVARPMLNLFYPVLSGIVQPLSGEYAGRRSALERLPFFTGYGVETGLLIDMLNVFGLQAIAQCDLEERVHKNQDLTALGKMSFQILQVFVSRLEARSGPMAAEINKTMKLIQHDQDRLYLDMQDVEEHERPPMIAVPAYKEADRPR